MSLAKMQISGIVDIFRDMNIQKADDCRLAIDTIDNILVFMKMWQFLLSTKEYMQRWSIPEQIITTTWLQRTAKCSYKQSETFLKRLVEEGILQAGEDRIHFKLKLGGAENGVDEQSSDV